MSEYEYDHLLAGHFEKTAVFGMAAGLVGRAGAALAARSSPALARAGTWLTGRAAPAIANAGKTVGTAIQTHAPKVHAWGKGIGDAYGQEGFKGFAGNFGRGMFGQQARGGVESAAHTLGSHAGLAQGAYGLGSAVLGGGSDKQGSLRETPAQYTFKGAEGHSWQQKALHAAPYVAWLSSQALEDNERPWARTLGKGLNLAAYPLYAGMSAYDAIKHPENRLTSGTDAVALTAMGLADLARLRRNSQNPAEGH